MSQAPGSLMNNAMNRAEEAGIVMRHGIGGAGRALAITGTAASDGPRHGATVTTHVPLNQVSDPLRSSHFTSAQWTHSRP